MIIRLLTFTLLIFSASSADARKCYLSSEIHPNFGDQVVYCGKNNRPKNAVCEIEGLLPKGSLRGADIKVEQVPINDEGEDAGFIERMANEIGLKNLETRTRCTVDTDKRQARLDSERAAREAEEQAREAERLKRVEAKAALRAMKGKVKDLTKDEMAEFLEKVIELQAGE